MSLVQLWQAEFQSTLPKVEPQMPIDMPIEAVDPAAPSVSLQLVQSPPPPRLWFLDRKGGQLIQVQRDWFARNWRKVSAASKYPRYPGLRRAFERDLSALIAYVKKSGFGDVKPVQCEITYINHVPVLASPVSRRPGHLLSLIDDRGAAFKEPLESLRIAVSYAIHHEDSRVGRLHVSVEPAIRRLDAQPIEVLTITARGAPIGDGIKGTLRFLDLGRQWARRAFTGLTRNEMQEIWRKTNGDSMGG